MIGDGEACQIGTGASALIEEGMRERGTSPGTDPSGVWKPGRRWGFRFGRYTWGI